LAESTAREELLGLSHCPASPNHPRIRLGKAHPLLRLKYHDSLADAVADLGQPDQIGRLFSSFQKYLYEKAA
jgi:hypothetical protein